MTISPISSNRITKKRKNGFPALPANEQRVSKLSGAIRTVGNKWADYQMTRYKSFQQPLYVVTDHEGNDLTKAIGYTPDIKSYKKFLEGGIERFK